MSKTQKFPEGNDARNVIPTNPDSNDASDVVFADFGGEGMRVTASSGFANDDVPDDAEASRNSNMNNVSPANPKDDSASVDSKATNKPNSKLGDTSVNSKRNGVAMSSKGSTPRNVVLVDPNEKKTGREVAIVILCVAIVVLILLLCLRFFACSSDVYDPNAKEGMTPNKTEEEIREAMDRRIEEGMFAISIYSLIRFPDGTSEGEANIANVPNNNFDMKVIITEDATGDVLYESGIIKPNSYVDKIKLNKDLDAGTYDATATFHALDKETHEESGMTNAKVTIYVEN